MSLVDIVVDVDVTRLVSGTIHSMLSTLSLKQSTVAGYTVLLYDSAINLSDEVEYIWCSKKNAAKCALLGNKYLVLVILTLVNLGRLS